MQTLHSTNLTEIKSRKHQKTCLPMACTLTYTTVITFLPHYIWKMRFT